MDVDPEQLPLGFLLNTLGRLLFEETQRALAGLDADVPGLGILWLVSLDPGRPQSAYARFQHRDLTTFGRHVDRLETAGLLRRLPVTGDRRAHALDLTEAGRAVLAEGRARAGRAEARITGAQAAEVAGIKRLLASILRSNE